MAVDMPRKVGDMVVEDASQVTRAEGECSVVFSAIDMEEDAVKKLGQNNLSG